MTILSLEHQRYQQPGALALFEEYFSDFPRKLLAASDEVVADAVQPGGLAEIKASRVRKSSQ